MSFDPRAYLVSLAQVADEDIEIGTAALAFAALQQPGIIIDRYRHHLEVLVTEVSRRHAELLKEGAVDDTSAQLAALKHILHDKHAYVRDQLDPDNIQNSNLIRVIDRGIGAPLSLSILYLHVARAQGWNIDGLNVPAHFMCRLEKDGERLIFDPSRGCYIMGASDLRQMLKEVLGPHAELSAAYYEPVSNRDILIYLQNSIKFIQITLEDYQGALDIVEATRLLVPEEFRFLLDQGVLYAKLGKAQSAIDALENYIQQAPQSRDRQEAEMLLYELRRNL